MRSSHEQPSMDESTQSGVNVGATERVVSAIAGGALIVTGLARRTLGGALTALLGIPLTQRGITGHCPVYRKLGVGGSDAGPASHPLNRQIHGSATITLDRPVEDVYRFWRELNNLPRLMPQLRSLVTTEDRRSHGVWLGPGNREFQFDVEIVEDRENELISWRTTGPSQVKHRGKVEFRPAPNHRGTEVHLSYWFLPPMGVMGVLIARLMGFNYRLKVKQGLDRMKQVLEAGEIAIAATGTGREAQARGAVPHQPIDRVEESSEESFPASDAPSFTPGRA